MDKNNGTGDKPIDPRVAAMRQASVRSVSQLSESKIRSFFNLEKGYCTCGSLDSLCQRLGVSMADRRALIDRIVSMGLTPPK